MTAAERGRPPAVSRCRSFFESPWTRYPAIHESTWAGDLLSPRGSSLGRSHRHCRSPLIPWAIYPTIKFVQIKNCTTNRTIIVRRHLHELLLITVIDNLKEPQRCING